MDNTQQKITHNKFSKNSIDRHLELIDLTERLSDLKMKPNLTDAEKRIYDLFETPEGTVQTSPVTVKTRGGIPSSLGTMAKFRGGAGYGRNPVAQIKHKGDIHWMDLLDMSRYVGLEKLSNEPSNYAKNHPEKYKVKEGESSFRAHAYPELKFIYVPDADYNVPGDHYFDMVNDPDVAQWYKDKIMSEGREDQVYQFMAEFSHLMPEHQGNRMATKNSRKLREELEGKRPDASNYWMRDDREYQSHFSPEGGEKSLYDKFVTFKGRGEDPNSPEALERKRLYEEFNIYPQGITQKFPLSMKQKGDEITYDNPTMDGFDSVEERDEWRKEKLRLDKVRHPQVRGPQDFDDRYRYNDNFAFRPPPQDERWNWVALPTTYPTWERIRHTSPKELKSKLKTIKRDSIDKELQTSTSIPTSGRAPELVYKVNGRMRTGQEPNYYKVWDKKSKSWKVRPVESEELEYYRGKNKIQEKQMGGSLPKAQDGFALNQTSANPFIYGDWAEVSRNVNPDTGATTIIDERTGNRDVAYSKRGVNWKVGYENWLAAGNKGSLADFKIEAERWKKSQTENESDIQNRERTLPGDEASITEDFYGLEIGDSTEPTVLNGSDEPGGSTEGFYGDFGVQGNRELQGNAGVQGNTGTTTGNTTIQPLIPRPITPIARPEISFSQQYPGGSMSPRGEVLPDAYVDSNSSYEENSRIKNNGKEKWKGTFLEDTTVTDSDGHTNMNVKSVDNGNREKYKQVFNIYDKEDNLLVRDVEKTNAFGNVVNRNHTTREGELAGYGIKRNGGTLPKAQVGYEAVADPEVGAQLASPTMTEEEEYYNPEIRDITSGDWRQDFLYKNPWLMDTPIFGDVIKDLAKEVASQHSGATRSSVPLVGLTFDKVAGWFGAQDTWQYDGSNMNRRVGPPGKHKLLDIYFQEEDERDLAKSIYTPKDDYYEWLPSYSLKGNLVDEYYGGKKGGRPTGRWISNQDDISSIIDGLLKDEGITWEDFMTNKKTLFADSYSRGHNASRLLDANLAHHKQGLGWDEERQLPYMSISDAWDFSPGDYSKRWRSGTEKGREERGEEGGKETENQAYIQASIMHQAGNPFKIYDRFYIDPETRKYITDEDVAKRQELKNK